jgi:phosphatidylglycerophosphate synthase
LSIGAEAIRARAKLGEKKLCRSNQKDDLRFLGKYQQLPLSMNGAHHEHGDRRPIASRDRKSSQMAAEWLAKRGVSPNAISVAGMVCAVLAGLSFAATSRYTGIERLFWILGAVLVQARLLANMFDGMVAIATNKASAVGELYNEVPDRISDAAIFIGLGFAGGGSMVLGLAATCAAFFAAYVRAMGKVAGARQEFCGPMAKQHRMFAVTLLGTYNCVAPMGWQHYNLNDRIGLTSANTVLGIIIIGSLITAIRRLRRTAKFLRSTKP